MTTGDAVATLPGTAGTYLYGLGRIAEEQGSANEYYLGDALGSVRQLTNNYGEVVLAKSYDPYGNNLQSLGTGQTVYDFTGETMDANGLIYLRARYYNSADGRFMSRDTWEGDFYPCPGDGGGGVRRFEYTNTASWLYSHCSCHTDQQQYSGCSGDRG